MSIQDSVKGFLESSVIDFTFDFEQNNFQIYQELLELLNVNDNDDEDNKQFLIWSQYSCPKCETILNIYWSEKDGKEKGR